VGAIRRAVVSVSDKAGLVEFCQRLAGSGTVLLSTGGTSRTLREAGLSVTDVSAYTESPEIMDGRVKTLHPRVHGGILMRDSDSDRAELARIGGQPIDLVVVNLYPFVATVARGAAHEEIVENIDIGGPCLLRAAAKNYSRVIVVVDPADYARVAEAAERGISLALRAELAAKAFAHVAEYDQAISEYFSKLRGAP
jgi:phosphoribosylaminoimidazolecarboxamide formyltransferase / IMP cyclohydrolase